MRAAGHVAGLCRCYTAPRPAETAIRDASDRFAEAAVRIFGWRFRVPRVVEGVCAFTLQLRVATVAAAVGSERPASVSPPPLSRLWPALDFPSRPVQPLRDETAARSAPTLGAPLDLFAESGSAC